MTENQEKELFNILGTLVTEVRGIKSDVQDIKETQNEHSQKLDEHSRILNRLDAKTDSIAETVMVNDKRLTNAEKEISDLQTRVH
jgi:chromosome segregation ATPase